MFEELVVGDLMSSFSLPLNDIMKMGYFLAHRLWDISDEIKASKLSQFAIIADLPHSENEYRENIKSWLNDRQSRLGKKSDTAVPKEVISAFKENWEKVKNG